MRECRGQLQNYPSSKPVTAGLTAFKKSPGYPSKCHHVHELLGIGYQQRRRFQVVFKCPEAVLVSWTTRIPLHGQKIWGSKVFGLFLRRCNLWTRVFSKRLLRKWAFDVVNVSPMETKASLKGIRIREQEFFCSIKTAAIHLAMEISLYIFYAFQLIKLKIGEKQVCYVSIYSHWILRYKVLQTALILWIFVGCLGERKSAWRTDCTEMQVKFEYKGRDVLQMPTCILKLNTFDFFSVSFVVLNTTFTRNNLLLCTLLTCAPLSVTRHFSLILTTSP